MDTRNSALSRPVKAVLYLLLERPQAIAGLEVIDEPLPDEIVRSTIDVSLWSAEEKAKLMEHKAYGYYSFRLGADPVGDFLEAYRWLSGVEGLIGIANPNGATAHSAVWVRRLFEDGLDEVARRCPPLAFVDGSGTCTSGALMGSANRWASGVIVAADSGVWAVWPARFSASDERPAGSRVDTRHV